MEKFSDLGVSFQKAYGRPKTRGHNGKSEKSQFQEKMPSSTQVWKVSAFGEAAVIKLDEMVLSKRPDYARENRLYFNCLKQWHRSAECRSAKRCDRCTKKHHSLLHEG